MTEQIEIVFGTDATVDLSYVLFGGISDISKITVLLSGILSTLWTWSFFLRNCTLTAASVVNIGGRSV